MSSKVKSHRLGIPVKKSEIKPETNYDGECQPLGLSPVGCVKNKVSLGEAVQMKPKDLNYEDAKFLLDSGVKPSLIKALYSFKSEAELNTALKELGLHPYPPEIIKAQPKYPPSVQAVLPKQAFTWFYGQQRFVLTVIVYEDGRVAISSEVRKPLRDCQAKIGLSPDGRSLIVIKSTEKKGFILRKSRNKYYDASISKHLAKLGISFPVKYTMAWNEQEGAWYGTCSS